MNRTITSKEKILEAAKTAAKRNGLSQLNIRDTAKECGISIGSVYNYYPAKSDLIIAVIEDYWKHIFHNNQYELPKSTKFSNAFTITYQKLYESVKQFEEGLLNEITTLSDLERTKGREIESIYFDHIKKGLFAILNNDTNVKESLWTEEFTKEAFIEFVFLNMMAMLRENRSDCGFFTMILDKILYPAA